MEAKTNYDAAANVIGTEENDSIKNIGAYSTIEAGAGNDTIINGSEIMIGLRNDNGLIRYESFEVKGIYSSISGGKGNDRIIDKVGYSVLNGGAGADHITLGAFSTVEYGAGDGNDTIYGYNGRNAIHITSGSYSTTKSGNDLILKVGNGTLTVKQSAGLNQNIAVGDETLRPTYEDNYLRQIFGTEGDDVLYAPKSDITVEAYEGDDVIINNSNIGARSMLIGGLGNDSLVSNSPEITVEGGKGDDVIELSGVNQTVRYHSGEGNDTVIGYQSTDVIHLIDGADYETVANDFDVVISVGSGSITLVDALEKELNIDTTRDDEDYVEEFDWEIATPEHDKITYVKKKGIGFVTVADGFNGEVHAANFNNAVSQINASAVSGVTDLKGSTKAITLFASKGGSTLEGGVGNNKLNGGAGKDIFVYNVGNGQDVIGNTKDVNSLYQEKDGIVIVSSDHYDFGDVSIKDNKSAVVMTFNGDKKSKLTINKSDVDTPIKFYFGSSAAAAIANGYMTYGELPEGVEYTKNSKGALNYTQLTVDETVDGETINAAAIHSQLVTIDGSNAAGWLEIYGNEKNNVLKAGASGGVLSGGAGNDQLYGSTTPYVYDSYVFKMQPKGKKDVIFNYDEIDDIVIDTSLLDGEDLPIFDAELGVITYEGAKEGFNGFNDSKDDVVITLNKKNTITIKNAAGRAINLFDVEGTELGTFGHTLPSGLAYDKKRTGIVVEDAEFAGAEGDLEIDLSRGEDIYYKSALNVDMTGLEGNASLAGNAKNNILKAGNQYTEMRGGAGNDQYYGSTAEDANVDYIYSSGKDVIYNYDPDDDYVYIDGDTPIDYDVLATVTAKNFVEKGNDVILNLDKNNSITFKGGFGKVIEVFDDNGALDDGSGSVRYDFSINDGLKYNSTKRTEICVEDSDTAAVQGYLRIDLSNETNEEAFEFATTVKKINLSDITDSDFRAEIIGNAQNNEIYGANAGYNELYGGHQEFENPKKAKPSADKLYGGDGDDVFIYGVGDGKDVVINYSAYDVINLDDTYGEIETIVLTDKKNVVTIELNGDKNNVLTINKDDINRAIEITGAYGVINGLDSWYGTGDFGLTYGVDADNMTLSADGTKLSIGGEYSRYIYADAREISTQIKTMDARNAEYDVFVEMTGNGNNNVLYAGVGGSILDGGRDSVKLKATNDALHGNEGNDTFVYRFEDGLGGKDTIIGFDATTDQLSFDVAPTKVTANGTNLVFGFEDTIDDKKHSGTLIVNGTSKITSLTGVNIDVAGEAAIYKFAGNLRNAAWDSEGITSEQIIAGTVDTLPTEGNTAAQWTMLDENSYAYDYAGVQFTVSGSAVRDWAPDNQFARGAVIAVIESDGIPDGIMVDAANKTIILSDRFDESTARFTFGNDESIADYAWMKYITMMEVSIEYELPTEDYWFDVGSIDESPLNEIVSTEAALDLEKDFISRPPALDILHMSALDGRSARRHQK